MDELQAGLAPYVTAIDHVGIAVPDMDEAIAFHRDTLGLELYHDEVNEDQGVHEAMMRPPGGTGGTAVQLLAALGPDTTIGKFLARKGPGVQQIAYRVSDIDAATEALRAKGLRVIYEQAVRGTANSRVNFVHPKDAGGVLIELVEPAQEGEPADR
jgi:methylmalonyl-CoA/ethylmalonyl-CoA epimerase